jgi:carbon storage regulator
MLVLSRKKDEAIVVGDNVVITVVEIRGDKVRLGIEAPKEVPVHRQEVFDVLKTRTDPAKVAKANDLGRTQSFSDLP